MAFAAASSGLAAAQEALVGLESCAVGNFLSQHALAPGGLAHRANSRLIEQGLTNESITTKEVRSLSGPEREDKSLMAGLQVQLLCEQEVVALIGPDALPAFLALSARIEVSK